MDTKQFYQKFGTWLGLSFLTGAVVMVAAIGIFNPGFLGSSDRVLTFDGPTSAIVGADFFPSADSGATQVVISQPVAGDSYASTDAVTVTVEASNQQGIKNMAILIDDQLVKTCLSSRCAITVPATSLPGFPSHIVRVLATGLDGTSASAVSNFLVQY